MNEIKANFQCHSEQELQHIPLNVEKLEVTFNLRNSGLQYIALHFGPKLLALNIRPTTPREQNEELDFQHIHLPRLKYLSIQRVSLRGIHFSVETTPFLLELSIEYSEADYFHLNLPYIRRIMFERVFIDDPSGFGPSLSRCCRLEKFASYKLWGLGVGKKKYKHKMMLPRCTSVDFYRADDLDHLELWAPSLAEFNLQACYSLVSVHILKRKPNTFDVPQDIIYPTKTTNFRINLVNAAIPQNMQDLLEDERCRGQIFTTDPLNRQFDANMIESWYLGAPVPKKTTKKDCFVDKTNPASGNSECS